MSKSRLAGSLPLLALAALTLAACAKDEGAGSETSSDPGLALFNEVRCNSCHGPEAQGIARMGPALRDIKANWTEEELERYFVDPAPFRTSKPHLEELAKDYFAHMRAFPELSAEQRTLLARWTLGL